MRRNVLWLLATLLFFPLTFAYAVVPTYDELGRLMNGDEVYQANNPLPKGKTAPEIDRYDHAGMTKLLWAVQYRQIEEASKLLKAGANPNVVSASGRTALQIAVRMNNLKMARLLLSYKADPNRRNTLGFAQSEEMKKLLASKGASPSREKEKKQVGISLMSSEESEIIKKTLDDVNNHGKLIPTIAQAVILDRNPEYLDKMLKRGISVNDVDPVFGTGLGQFFEQRRDKAVARFLLKNGANPNLLSRGAHPMSMAVRYGDPEIFALMLAKGGDIKTANSDGQQILSQAAEKAQLAIVKLLLKAGADVNAKDKDGKTALYYVLWRNPRAVDVARVLLEGGASTTVAPKISALSVLQWREENLAMMQLLLQYKAQPVVMKDGTTLVMWAVKAGNMPLLEAAIQAGVDVNARDRDGDSALRDAVSYKRADAVRALLAAGAPVNGSVNKPGRKFVDSYGKVHEGTDDLLAIAVRKGDIDIINILIKAGVHLDTPANSFEQPTPLHMAAQQKRKDIVDVLLAAKANPNSLDRYGRTPLHAAARSGDAAIVQRLLQAKANPNIGDEEGETALDAAEQSGKKDISDILIKAGGKKGERKKG